MNTGFIPVVVSPSGFKVQRASQQAPFHFGGSPLPMYSGRGIISSRVYPSKSPATMIKDIQAILSKKGLEEDIPKKVMTELKKSLKDEQSDMSVAELEDALRYVNSTSIESMLRDLAKSQR